MKGSTRINRVLRRSPWILLLVVLAAMLAYGFWPAPVAVEVTTVRRGPLLVTVNDDGITRIREKYVVSAPVSGKLLRVELQEGDAVQRGQTVLARIEPSDPTLLDARSHAEAQARVQAAKAAQQQAEASLQHAQEASELADHRYDRARKLIEKEVITREDLDQAEHEHRMALADQRSAEFGLNVARFELELAKAALVRTRPADDVDDQPALLTILAPVTGRVLRVLEENAGAVTVGTELLELGNPGDLEMEIDVLSTDAVKIRPGSKVFVEHWGGDGMLEGDVRIIEPAAFMKVSALGVEEQRVNVIASFTSPLENRETLGDAYRIEARIVIKELDDALKVATGALFREGQNWFVFRVVEGRADLQQVQIGESNGLETEIVSGLSSNDVVVLHPTDKVQQHVRVRFDGPTEQIEQ